MAENILKLSEKIAALRRTASTIYDLGIADGKKITDLTEEMKPIRDAMEGAIKVASIDSLDSCAAAMLALEKEAESLEAMARVFSDKAQNSRSYVDRIRTALIDRMKNEKVTHLEGTHFRAQAKFDSDGYLIDFVVT